jgi:hypothetical protein
MSRIDLVGKKFGELTVIRLSEKGKAVDPRKKRAYWVCLCSCGEESEVRSDGLNNGIGQCKKCANKKVGDRHRKHGQANKQTPEYRAWHHIKDRCINTNNKRYHDYGGRGVKICERWMEFENFYEDMGKRPSSSHSIDRYPNNDGDYEKSNCRWATTEQQSRGKRNNRWVEYNGDVMIISDLAKVFHIGKDISYFRKRVLCGKVNGVKLIK